MFIDKTACFPPDGSAEATQEQMRNYTNLGLLLFREKKIAQNICWLFVALNSASFTQRINDCGLEA